MFPVVGLKRGLNRRKAYADSCLGAACNKQAPVISVKVMSISKQYDDGEES
ncbi:hypothetical protein HMPREF9946_00303 [Acetobacteraceae bacterium AT-5844]|nr:hypothetical protein HMPREF9946_00303 [Acetobacteraceae bacterium AT-5844]